MVFLVTLFTIRAAAEPLTLRQAVEQAGRLSPEIAAVHLGALAAESEIASAKSQYRPQVSLRAGLSGQLTNLQGIGLAFPGFSNRIGPFSILDVRPVVTQTILDAGLLSRIRAARAAFAQNRAQAEAIRETTQLAVVELYLQSLQAVSRVAASQARLSTAQAVLAQAKDKEAAGAASKLDVARAEQELRNEEAILIQLERDQRVLKTNLIRTIGLDLRDDQLQLESLGRSPLEWLPPAELSLTREGRAEVQAAEAAVRQSGAEREAVQREYWPKASFQADWGVFGSSAWNAIGTYTVGATLTVPIWTSGRIEAERKAAEAREQRAKAELRAKQLKVTEEMRQSLLEWRASRDASTASERAAAAARESLELARLRFDAGLSTNIDTVTAQARLADAEDLAIRTRYDVFRARARYSWATGSVLAFLEGL